MMDVVDLCSSPEPSSSYSPLLYRPMQWERANGKAPVFARFPMDIVDIGSSSDIGIPELSPNAQRIRQDSEASSEFDVGPSTDSSPGRAHAGPSNLRPTGHASAFFAAAPNAIASSSKSLAPPVPLKSSPSPDDFNFDFPSSFPLFLPDNDDAPPVGRSKAEIKGARDKDAVRKAAPVPVAREPSLETCPIDRSLARVLEIVPDVLPAHARDLVERHLVLHGEGAVEHVLHLLLEDTSYPKIDRKGKRKREEDDEGEGAKERSAARQRGVDYSCATRTPTGGPHYAEIAFEQLCADFPYFSRAHNRTAFVSHSSLYAPTYLALLEEKKQSRGKGKRKSKTVSSVGYQKPGVSDAEFERERDWLLRKLRGEADVQGRATVVGPAQEPTEEETVDPCEDGSGIECGCCFSAYRFNNMVQCPDAHLFCKSCIVSYASTLLGGHDANIVCMDQGGCKLPFPPSELARVLPPRLAALRERLVQNAEIAQAGLDGLEECPHCEFKVVIENPDEKLFTCQNAECGAVTCRKCKGPDHLPKSCDEVKEDKHLDARHAVEEAMTEALMRKCPKCQKSFVKEMGCNKMTCPQCGTVSCYICRKVINGYDHFSQPPPYNNQPDPKKCLLWDTDLEKRHADEVAAAAKRALEAYERDHPGESVAADLQKLAVPAAVPARGAPPAPVHAHAHLPPVAGPGYYPHPMWHPAPHPFGVPPGFGLPPPYVPPMLPHVAPPPVRPRRAAGHYQFVPGAPAPPNLLAMFGGQGVQAPAQRAHGPRVQPPRIPLAVPAIRRNGRRR